MALYFPIRTQPDKLISFIKSKLKKITDGLVGKKPSWQQWKCLFKVLVPREQWLIRGLSAVIIISILLIIFNGYLGRTQTEPKIGGKYTEGLLGQPRYINPVLSQLNDVDRDLVEIIFSGLFTYDNQGNLIPELAESYTIEEDGLVYNITLKNYIKWHNGESLTADDVIFTIKTIQNKEYNSPLEIIWQGVEVEKIDDFTVRFRIQNTYAPFLHNLTLGILPKHLWAGISAQNFPLADYNLYPVGSGPYQFKKINKDKSGKVESIILIRSKNYLLASPLTEENEDIDRIPFIETLVFNFYDSQPDLINAYNGGNIDGFTPVSATNQPKTKRNTKVYPLNLPIYHAVFFNQIESKPLADKNVRLALTRATNKQELLEKVLQNQGTIIDSPLFLDWLNNGQATTTATTTLGFDLEKARQILEENKWVDSDEDGVRDKMIDKSDEEPTKLEITLITTDWPELSQTAQLLKEQWEKLDIQINMEMIDPISIKQDYIRSRDYHALLFGEVLGADPDPFAFWHSSQKKDPGLNLALYQNKKADKLLEEARQALAIEERIEKYNEFQEIIVEDMPAVFLYSPTYFYSVNKRVKGINLDKLPLPSQRFCGIENWYIKTKRISK